MTYRPKSWHFDEKDLINLLSPATVQAQCVKSGTFPAHPGGAKLYYQYNAASDTFNITVAGSSVAETAVISEGCVAIDFPALPAGVWSGTRNTVVSNLKQRFSGNNSMTLLIQIPSADTSTSGLFMMLNGMAKEKLNLTPLNKKGEQTLTDTITVDNNGFGYQVKNGTDPLTCDSAYGNCTWFSCTGTIHANGKIKNK